MKLFAKNLSKKESKAVIKELQGIEKQNGVITAKAVVQRAKNESSPLHRFFNWDDTKAANEYRLWQARMIVARVYVSTPDTDPNKPVLRAFVNISPGEDIYDADSSGRGYIGIENAKKSAPLRDQVLQYAKDQLFRWEERFGAMQEFFEVSVAIKSLKK